MYCDNLLLFTSCGVIVANKKGVTSMVKDSSSRVRGTATSRAIRNGPTAVEDAKQSDFWTRSFTCQFTKH